MTLYTIVGERIRRYRTARGWTQGELGAGFARPVSHAAVSNLENGVTRANLDYLAEVATVLGVALETLILGIETDAPPRATPTPPGLYGWICPGCSHGYSPFMSQCTACPPPVSISGPTNGVLGALRLGVPVPEPTP